jgi:hypothetical protein
MAVPRTLATRWTSPLPPGTSGVVADILKTMKNFMNQQVGTG